MSNFKSNRIFAVAIICLKQISFVIISYDNTYTCLLYRPNNRNHIEQDYIRKQCTKFLWQCVWYNFYGVKLDCKSSQILITKYKFVVTNL